MSEKSKTSLEKALLETREIEQAAINSAKKVVEESTIAKMNEAVKKALEELENKTIEEGVEIEVGDADISVSVEDGVTSIKVDAEEDDLNIIPTDEEEEGIDSEEEIESKEEDETEKEEFESEEDDEDEDEELFEVNLFEEEIEEAPVEEAPVEEAPVEEAPVEGDLDTEEDSQTVEVPTKSAIEQLSSKLDAILSKLEQPQENIEAAQEEEEVASEKSEENPAAEGEVEIEITDDEATEAPETEEEVVSEEYLEEIEVVDEDEEVSEKEIEDILAGILPKDNEEGDEDILDIETEEELEEVMGVGHGVQRAFGNKTKAQGHHSPIAPLHENNAHNEAKIAELTEENESLKESLKEYKESFKVLRKQINEVQTFNAKLAYVNKLFSKGGLTNDEKVKIAENFDETNTVEEAKTLYNKIISESTNLSNEKTEQLKSKLKSTSPSITPVTKTEALYENKEVARMKLLAGINKTLNS